MLIFAEFSKESWERWKTMSEKEKLKFEALTKNGKALYDRGRGKMTFLLKVIR
jgi:hypothetical protein